MRQQFPYWLVLLVIVSTVSAGGCGSTPPISLTTSPSSAQAIDQSQTVAVTANITDDFSLKGVSWTLNGPGSLSNTTGPGVTYISSATAITSPARDGNRHLRRRPNEISLASNHR
jgi:hypothetical protein